MQFDDFQSVISKVGAIHDKWFQSLVPAMQQMCTKLQLVTESEEGTSKQPSLHIVILIMHVIDLLITVT
jgi:hypothetical protein